MKVKFDITEQATKLKLNSSGGNTSKADVTTGLWELDGGLKLHQRAAEFYLMYDLSLDDLDGGRFNVLLEYLLQQFTAYTDMAVGGELRHSKGKVHAGTPKPLKTALADGTLPNSRHEAWRGWYKFRMHYGTLALKWAEETFLLFKGGGYGGPPWSNIAKVLKLYEQGDLGPISFVDTCWGLEHNGGAYFNKVWNTAGLKAVLDANLNEKTDHLLETVAVDLRKFYKQQKEKA